MMTSKLTSQNWTKSVQDQGFKDEKVNTVSATQTTDDDKALGDKLNAIANPGGKNPNKPARRAHNTLDKDDFLKLMLTQMKNQDPMSPMQSHEMAAQLAQFTSLEQLFNVNKNLEGLTKSQEPMQKFEVLNFLGKTIKSDTRQIFRAAGDQASDLRFNLGTDAAKVKVTINDDAGQVVKEFESASLKKGDNRIPWNGTDKDDRDVRPGRYTFTVEAETSAGHKVAVTTETRGVISGVNYTPEGPMLMVGDQKVRLQDVQRIEDDQIKAVQDQAVQVIPSARLIAPQQGNGQEVNPGAQQGAMLGPQSAHSPKPKVKPETKPEAKLSGAVIPLEVASANAMGAGTGSGITAGGAFGRK